MSSEQSPFADLDHLLSQLPAGDTEKCTQLENELSTKPVTDSFGLKGLLSWLSMWQEAERLSVKEAHICILASAYKGISDIDVVKDYIERASKGRTPVNHMCVKNGIGLRILELAPEVPHDLSQDWSERDCMGAIAFGMEATASGGDILGLSDLAPGNQQQAIKIIKACEDLLKDTRDAVNTATYLELLQKHGGREIAAIIGAMIAARSRRLPVLVEGWGALAAFVLLHSIDNSYVDHVRVASFSSIEQRDTLSFANINPVVGEYVGTGQGCGIALAIGVISGAATLLDVPDV
ncbi:nicotinate-nucleotide--dimethylbenzimidazole phosphoribosyltransferase [Kordiimonas sp. SCSIO 12610]|uniref:nicotinate-nucleotide--dimethylbenzimidazole phosphoribosyltransferase n=1 Tax=Kordiimonas sp. SCSIO 12610 TaxID=2829597 RepID=UPI00210C2EE4|nr:nicotinate-nucleotide--dimethylbenzimidazole phosphoribosyltransferase [Kordiimonas sp. SCSIO 12610]UTW54163.1 nicotinate-nucleotide--dimethylbenzimidazole phosphoribosyltransferase [Kordiimonas sp. SCSIO 12610]